MALLIIKYSFKKEVRGLLSSNFPTLLLQTSLLRKIERINYPISFFNKQISMISKHRSNLLKHYCQTGKVLIHFFPSDRFEFFKESSHLYIVESGRKTGTFSNASILEQLTNSNNSFLRWNKKYP